MALWILLGLIAALVGMFFDISGIVWLAGIAVWLAVGYTAGAIGGLGLIVLAILFFVPGVILVRTPLRRALVTPKIFAIFKRILPAMSATERDALEAGTTWWDAELFSGKPDWQKLLRAPA